MKPRQHPAPLAARVTAAHNPATWSSSAELIQLSLRATTIDPLHRQAARTRRGGAHPSRFRGRGMDYAESRVYQAGDDIRSMDWRVTARAGDAHVKVFQEERERPVLLCLDLNPGMFFASRGVLKSVQAARAAALIGWAAVNNGDRVGGLLFNGAHQELPPRRGRSGILRLIRALVESTEPLAGLATAPHPGALNGALLRLRRLARPGSLIFLFSDFYDRDEETALQLLNLRRHNDLVAVQLVDPLELAAPPPARYGVSDQHQLAVLDTRGQGQRHRYENAFADYQRALQQLLRSRAIEHLQISTTDDPGDALARQFPPQRLRRAGREVV